MALAENYAIIRGADASVFGFPEESGAVQEAALGEYRVVSAGGRKSIFPVAA